MKSSAATYAGRGVRAGGFDAGAGASSRFSDMARWAPAPLSADAALLDDHPALVGRAEDLGRNSGVAISAREAKIDNVIGTGLRVKPRPAYAQLGRDRDWQEAWSRDVAARYNIWAKSKNCDVSRQMNLAQMTQIAYRSAMESGDALALPMWRPERRNPTALMLVDAARLEAPPSHRYDPKRRAGIDFDGDGAPKGYWIRRAHPNDGIWSSMLLADHEYVPARTAWGRRRVIHVFDRLRVGQSRGVSHLAAAMREVKSLDRYKNSELQAAVVNALIAAFIETPLAPEEAAQILGLNNDGGLDQHLGRIAGQKVALQGGSMPVLPPGTSVKPFTPARPATAFAAFVEASLRNIAAGLNLPYELLAKDFSKTNYSSARAALLEAWRHFRRLRANWASDWNQEIYELWLEAEIDAGRVEAPDFYENRDAWCLTEWVGDGRGWIDPVKEAQAALMRIDGQLSTLEAECAEQGMDWREVLEQQARERDYRRELGLPDPVVQGVTEASPSDGADEEKPGAAPAEPAKEPAE